MMDIKNKIESFRRWHAGLFGNKLRTWDAPDQISASGYQGTVSMRYKAEGGGFCAYEVPLGQIGGIISAWKDRGAKEELITYNESAPDHLLVVQGEISVNPSYILFYSYEKEKMRNALRNGGRHAYGLEAKLILEGSMTPSSFSDLQALLELYPDSIIEFSTYSICLGDRPGRNTVIWEVRNY